LGQGLTGRAVRYALNEMGATWTGIYWQWPVRDAIGLRYERVVLSARETLVTRAPPTEMAFDPVSKVQLAIGNSSRYVEGPKDDWSSPPQRDFMVALARTIVAASIARVETHTGLGVAP